MNWFKKHTDTVVVLAAFASCMMWMNGKFNDIEKDVSIIKTVMIMKNIMPADLTANEINNE